MKLFLDTEFTDLVPHNKLISIALVNEREEFFYAELNDTYKVRECSDFVKKFVLPLLRGGEYVMSSQECSLKIGSWIEEQGRCILACDNPGWDIPHLKRLLDPIWPENLIKDSICQVYVPPHIAEDIVLENNYDIHNALDDAMVMKKATELKAKHGY